VACHKAFAQALSNGDAETAKAVSTGMDPKKSADEINAGKFKNADEAEQAFDAKAMSASMGEIPGGEAANAAGLKLQGRGRYGDTAL
jgi:hypothetical protein